MGSGSSSHTSGNSPTPSASGRTSSDLVPREARVPEAHHELGVLERRLGHDVAVGGAARGGLADDHGVGDLARQQRERLARRGDAAIEQHEQLPGVRLAAGGDPLRRPRAPAGGHRPGARLDLAAGREPPGLTRERGGPVEGALIGAAGVAAQVQHDPPRVRQRGDQRRARLRQEGAVVEQAARRGEQRGGPILVGDATRVRRHEGQQIARLPLARRRLHRLGPHLDVGLGLGEGAERVRAVVAQELEGPGEPGRAAGPHELVVVHDHRQGDREPAVEPGVAERVGVGERHPLPGGCSPIATTRTSGSSSSRSSSARLTGSHGATWA